MAAERQGPLAGAFWQPVPAEGPTYHRMLHDMPSLAVTACGQVAPHGVGERTTTGIMPAMKVRRCCRYLSPQGTPA